MLTKDVFKSWETGQKALGVAWGVFLEHVMRSPFLFLRQLSLT